MAVPFVVVVVLVVLVLLLVGDGRSVELPVMRGSVSCEVSLAADVVGVASDVSLVVLVPVAFGALALVVALVSLLVV